MYVMRTISTFYGFGEYASRSISSIQWPYLWPTTLNQGHKYDTAHNSPKKSL
ncbi:unnamed protein product, partial [Cylicocyclus nassatus]